MELLNVDNLFVNFEVFEGKRKVLNGVRLQIDDNEKVGLVGETGCGKSVLAKTILGFLPIPPGNITNGRVTYLGKDLLEMSHKERKNLSKTGDGISVIFQDPQAALNPVFTVGQQIFSVIKHSSQISGNNLSKEEIRRRSITSLEEVNLPDHDRILSSYPVQLSGGEKQRVCISEALSTGSRLLIADEPTTNLDVTIQDKILDLLDELYKEKGISILFISHSLGVIRKFTDAVNIMYAGDRVESATSTRIFSSPLHPYTKGLMDSVPKLTNENIGGGIPGEIPSYLEPPNGCRFHPRCSESIKVCRKRKPPSISVRDGHYVSCFLYGR